MGARLALAWSVLALVFACASADGDPADGDGTGGGPVGGGAGGGGAGPGGAGGGGGLSCDAVPGCAGHADCYPDGLCVAPGGCETCVPPPPCARGAGAPAFQAGGPLLIEAAQQRLGGATFCTSSAACGDGLGLCEFVARYFDPEGDVGSAGAGPVVFTVAPGVSEPALQASLDDRGILRFRACFAVTAGQALAAAVQVEDDAGHPSNVLCLDGAF